MPHRNEHQCVRMEGKVHEVAPFTPVAIVALTHMEVPQPDPILDHLLRGL
jgi:hypothetical protein